MERNAEWNESVANWIGTVVFDISTEEKRCTMDTRRFSDVPP